MAGRPPQAGERLEQRQMLAFDFVAAFAGDITPFYVSGVTPGVPALDTAPQEITLRFSPGVTIDSSSVDAITVSREGQAVQLGSVTVNDAPNQNEVILRFAESLPDATYRIDIGAGLASTSTAVGTVNAARFDVKVELGAHVVSVVPQPVSRGATGLTQAKNQIVVYFNANDPLNQNSAESTSNYKLYEINPTTGAETLSSIGWAQNTPIVYSATAATATLTFAADLDNNKLYRLQVGNDGTANAAFINVRETTGGGTDDNSSFETARVLGPLGTAGATVNGALDVRPTVPTPAGPLPFPSAPGAIDEPGHRDISVNLDPPDTDGVQIINTGEDHGLSNAGTAQAGAVHVQAYNFKSFYGFGVQGQQLYNAISEAQKQRAREIFELYSRYTGIRFVETASDGITVVTGDMRAIDPEIVTTPDGLTGTPIDPTRGRVFGVTAIMDATNSWGSSEYGGAWFREAMEQIGHALGLSNSFDIPSIMGAALPGEPVFPGDYDILHAAMLYPASGTDIDIYRFSLPSAGRLTAQTDVARPGELVASRADTVLTLYLETTSNGVTTREMIARNDDYYGRDSFVDLDLEGGDYYVAVTSTGNTDFNPEIENSGANGRSDGAYELRLNFTPNATSAGTIRDVEGTLFDGDRDGVAGGVFNFWFRTGDTVFVDKAAPTADSNGNPITADGTAEKPFRTIAAAISAVNLANSDGNSANDKQIIRIVGNVAQTPYQIGRNASNAALPDGATLNVPRGVTLMIDAGAVFKLSKANIDVGTSAAAASRAGAALQVLGTPAERVTFTSFHDDTIGGDIDGSGPPTQGGQWGGIVFRQDSDVAPDTEGKKRAFVNVVTHADIRYGGGQVVVDSKTDQFTPLYLETSRPTIAFNRIAHSAGAAISADPNSFEDDGRRAGPEIIGNVLEEIKKAEGVAAGVVASTAAVAGAAATVGTAVVDGTIIELTAAVARVGATVGGEGVPDGTTVTDVDGAEVTLSQPVTVAAGAVLTFSLAGQSIASGRMVAVADPDKVRVGAPVAGAGVPAGITVTDVNDSVVTFSGDVTLSEGAVLSFDWASNQNRLQITEPVARVGASLFINGVDTGLDVSAIDDVSGVLRLSGNLPETLAAGRLVGFSLVPTAGAVSTSRVRVAERSGITVGGVVRGAAGVPRGTEVVSVTPQGDGFVVELDRRVEVVAGTPIGFGSNSINGLFIRIKTNAGSPIDRLDVPARFKSTDITYVLAENLLVSGGAGGYVDVAIATPRVNLVVGSNSFTLPAGMGNDDWVGMRVTGPGIPDGAAIQTISQPTNNIRTITLSADITRSQSRATVTIYDEQARQSGRLTIDPGVIVKLDRSRIELERGGSQLFAEGTADRRVIFTSLADNRFGAGGTFDTNGNQPDKFDQFGRSIDVDGSLILSPTTGDWGGIILNAGAKASIDQSYIAFGGGTTPIEGGFDQFNVIEVQQGDLRLANSRIERNAEGLATTDRTGRQGNDSATIFVRGAQPVIIRNDFRDNAGAMISINANSLNDSLVPDPGRGTGTIDRYGDYDANFGPLVRDNRISYLRNTPVTGGAVATAPAAAATGSSSNAPAATITQMQWNGQSASVVANSWVFRAADESFAIDAGWQARSLGGGFYSMTAPGAGVQDVLAWSQSQTTIDFVEPNFVRTVSALPNDPSFSSLWGLENTGQPGGQEFWDFTGGLPTVGVIDADIDAPAAWDVTTGSSNVVIAVIDTGVDYTHEDLAANMWRNPGEIAGNNIDDDGNGFVDDVFGWDFGSNDNDPNDDSADPGHGTHVAGTIGAAGNNGVGVTGVNWNVGIMALKIADDAGNLTTSAIIGAINYVTMMREQFGVNIVASNNSYGGYGISSAERAAIDAHCAADVVFVAAAGNESINNDIFPAYPASHNNPLVISVAATDRANQLARFTNTGVTTVDIAAPGVAILSTTPGNNYEYYGGTSMASPHVAGVIGLLAAAFPNATGAQIRDAILDSAVPVASLANRVATGGLLNAAAALDTLRGTTGISGMVVRGEEITVESVWDDTDIVHVLRSEIVVNNFHTKTGLRLLSQPDESLVVKLQGTTAGFTATGTALDIDDRIGGTVQLVGQPGYPVVLTSLADDTVGVSLDALGRVVRDTNGDGSASSPAPGDWRSLRFEPLSNDRNVAILLEREAGVTGGIDANGTTDDAQVLGTLAPNYATTNDQGTLNSWESAQEKSGDESLRQGFEVHGSVAFDDPTDVDVYTFTGYAGSEVWIDVDNTSPSLDAMVELLDASGNVIARSVDSLNDIDVVRSGVVAELPGGRGVVAGFETTVIGVAAATDRVAAQVAGSETNVTGVASAVNGVGAQVAGRETTVTGVASAVTGVGARVAGNATTVTGVQTAVVGAAISVVAAAGKVTAVNGAQVTIDNGTFIQAGARVYVNNAATGATVLTNQGGALQLSGALPAGVAVDDVLGFSIEGAGSVRTKYILVANADLSRIFPGAGVAGTTVANKQTAQGNSWVEFDQAQDVSADQTLRFGLVNTSIVPVDEIGAVVQGDFVTVGGEQYTVNGRDIDNSTITLDRNVSLADGDLLTVTFNSGQRTATRVVVADATGANTGVPVTGTGIAVADGVTVVGPAVGDVVTLSGPESVRSGQQIAFGFNSIVQNFTTVTFDPGNVAGIAVGGAVFRNGDQVGVVDAVNGDAVTVDTTGHSALAVADNELLTFGFVGVGSITTSVIQVDDIAAVGVGDTVDGLGVTVTGVDAASGTVTLSGNIAAANGDLLSFAPNPATNWTRIATRVVVADATGANTGVPVTGTGIAVADGVTVVGPAVGNVITLNGAESVSRNQQIAFGFNTANSGTITFDLGNVADVAVGAAVFHNGAQVGVVDAKSPTTVDVDTTGFGALAVANDEFLGFEFGGVASIFTRVIQVDDIAAVGVADTVSGVGVAGGITVVSRDLASGTVTLSGPITAADGNLLSFTPNATNWTRTATRLVVADATGANAGVPVTGDGIAVADGVTVEGPAVGNVIALSAAESVDGDQPIAFGFNASVITFEDITGVRDGSLVSGTGVPANTEIIGVYDPVADENDPNYPLEPGQIEFSQPLVVTDGAPLFFGARSFQLHPNVLPGTLSGVVYVNETAIQTFTVDRAGEFTFDPIGDSVMRVIGGAGPADSVATLDIPTGIVSLPFDVVPLGAVRIEVAYEFGRLSPGTLGFSARGEGGAMALAKDDYRGADMYSTNPRNPGMRVVLPGEVGAESTYFVRVRSQPRQDSTTLNTFNGATVAERYESSLTSTSFDQSGSAASGASSGRYELRIRERQQDEKPGSTVRYADLRFPTVGIDVIGLPRNSQLVGETGEMAAANGLFSQAQQLGNLLATDRNTISVAGTTTNESDIDWYTFTVDFTDIDVIESVNDVAKTWATMFDIDYADGFKGDLTISVFDGSGTLIYVGRDSNITDDQPGENQGNDFDDLSRGSVGVLDPYIGSVQLPAGSPGSTTRYYVAVSSNERLPTVLNATFQSNATNPLIRLEPVSSVRRIVEDHIGSTGYSSHDELIAPVTGPIIDISSAGALETHIRPFTLDDLTVFVATTGGLRAINPFTGQADQVPRSYSDNWLNVSEGDLDMLTNGSLVLYGREADGVGTVWNIDPATGARSTRWTDGIGDDEGGNPPPNSNAVNITNAQVDAVVIGRSDVAQYSPAFLGAAGAATFYSMRDNFQLPGERSVIYAADGNGSAATVIVGNTEPLSQIQFGRMGYVPSGIDLSSNNSAIGYVAGNNNLGGNGSGTVIDGFTTGLQFRNENRNASELYAVSSGGQFFRIQPQNPNARAGATAGPANVTGNLHDPLTIHDARDFSTLLNGRSLQGLATAPVNLEGGRYQGMFMAITEGGGVFFIDPDGAGPGNAAVVDNVFDTNEDGIGDSWISNEALGGVRGLAVAPLDINLWHPTEQRWSDSGHGIDYVPDSSRNLPPVAGTSMYFGLDGWGEGNDFWSYGGSGQFGTASYNHYNWQQELTAGLGANNYNMPGGARGSMVTKPFSLAGYEYADKPTLYFNYFLETDGTNDELFDNDSMRDSARVFASRDGGLTWELLATNNSIRSSLEPFAPRAELSPSGSASSRIGNPETSSQPTQQVQELFDNTGGWRQARIDIGEFAGESNIQLRFDFSTGGDFNRTASGDNATATPSAVRSVTVAAVGNGNPNQFSIGVDSAEGIQVGMRVQRWWDTSQQFIDPTADLLTPAAGIITAANEATAEVVGISIDPQTNDTVITVQVSPNANSSFVVGESLAFFPNRTGVNVNNILGAAGEIGGDSNVATRSTDNAHEGFYIDDIIVGFAERGEMVTSAIANQGFFDIGTPTGTSEYPEQVLEGEYQLEIRRGTEYAEIISSTTPRSRFVEIQRVFDTNDRLVPAPAAPEIVLERNDLSAIGGNVGRLGNGDITPANNGLQMVGNGGNLTAFNAITWSVDLAGQSSAFLEVEYSTGWQFWPRASEPLTPLPLRFTLGDDQTTGATENNQLPAGDGIAVSVDGGNEWFSVLDFAATSDPSVVVDVFRTGRVDLVAALNRDRALGQPVGQNSHLTATTVIGFFQSGTLTAAQSGGVTVRNAIITAAPRTHNVGLVGDSNLPRQQGRFLIENNFIANAALYGVRIDAARDNGIVSLQPGVARNLPTLNNGRLAPGVVVTNNIITGSGTAGILFSGDSNSGGNSAALATVPYGRIVNNTIHGDVDGQNAAQGVGIDIEHNAAPTLLNNLFANLASGILVDGSSIADGSGNIRTVVGYSAFFNVSTEVSAAVAATSSITLLADPFVAADRGNFYLAAQSRAIDSAIDVLQDRNEFVTVTNHVGIPESPILAPALDIYGQARWDDPNVASVGGGLGFNVFKDRGAVDRIDFARPTIRLSRPLDNASDDEDDSAGSVKLREAAARGQLRFVLQLDDIGSGIDKSSVDTRAFELRYAAEPNAPAAERRLLVDGEDYFFRFLETTNEVVFDSPVLFTLGSYEIRVTSRQADGNQPSLLTDLAGNVMLPNSEDGSITFTVSLMDKPATPTLVAQADEGRISLEWSAFANGSVITAFTLQRSTTGEGGWFDVDLGTDRTVTEFEDSGLVDGQAYWYRIKATNALGESEWTEDGPHTPTRKPVVSLFADTGSRDNDFITNDATVRVSGLLSGATWRYRINGAEWEEGNFGAIWQDGDPAAFELPDGQYATGTIEVRQTLDNIESPIGHNANPFTIDTVRPGKPVVAALIDDRPAITGNIANGGLTDDDTPTFQGTAEAGAIVRVEWKAGAEEQEETVLQTGHWEMPITLDDGEQDFEFVAIDLAGNISDISTFSVTVDTEGPRVVITSVADDKEPLRGEIPNAGGTNDNTPVVSGTAPPSSVVTLKARQGTSTRVVATVVSNPIGAWTVTTATLADGTAVLWAEVTDALGRTGISDSRQLRVDTTVPRTPVIVDAFDNVGDSTGILSQGATTDDFLPELRGTADQGSLINIVITLPSGERIIRTSVATASDAGVWSWTPGTPFGTLGTHVFRAIATDAAGNTSPVSSEFRLRLSGDPPAPPPNSPPVISAVIDNYANTPPADVTIRSGGTTDDNTPMIHGTAPVGQQVTVVAVSGGRQVFSKTVDSGDTGLWSFVSDPLPNGTYELRATSESGESGRYSVTIAAPTSGQGITATAEWGPASPAGDAVNLDFSEPVSGSSLQSIVVEYRGRKVALRNVPVTSSDNRRYVITLPSRVRREAGDYAIILMYEQIRSLADPTRTMDGRNARIIIANPPEADPGQA